MAKFEKQEKGPFYLVLNDDHDHVCIGLEDGEEEVPALSLGIVRLSPSRRALKISLPYLRYEDKNHAVYILRDECQPNQLVFELPGGSSLELKLVSIGESGS